MWKYETIFTGVVFIHYWGATVCFFSALSTDAIVMSGKLHQEILPFIDHMTSQHLLPFFSCNSNFAVLCKH